jgi:hypothetical protein
MENKIKYLKILQDRFESKKISKKKYKKELEFVRNICGKKLEA